MHPPVHDKGACYDTQNALARVYLCVNILLVFFLHLQKFLKNYFNNLDLHRNKDSHAKDQNEKSGFRQRQF